MADEELVRPNLTRFEEVEHGVQMVVLERLYKMQTCAKMLDVTVGTLDRYRAQGTLKVLTTVVGKRIRHSDFTEFINAYYGKKD